MTIREAYKQTLKRWQAIADGKEEFTSGRCGFCAYVEERMGGDWSAVREPCRLCPLVRARTFRGPGRYRADYDGDRCTFSPLYRRAREAYYDRDDCRREARAIVKRLKQVRDRLFALEEVPE